MSPGSTAAESCAVLGGWSRGHGPRLAGWEIEGDIGMTWHGGIGWFRGNPSPNWFWLWNIWINMMYMFTLFIRFSNTDSVGGGGSLPCHSRKSSILVFCLCGTGSQRGEMGHDQMVPELNGRNLSVNPRCLKLSRECETYIDLLPTFLTVFSLDLRAGEITSWTLVFVCKYSSCLGAFVILRELWPTVSSMENIGKPCPFRRTDGPVAMAASAPRRPTQRLLTFATFRERESLRCRWRRGLGRREAMAHGSPWVRICDHYARSISYCYV